MSEFLYNLKVGQIFLLETWNPKVLLKKKRNPLHKTFRCKNKTNTIKKKTLCQKTKGKLGENVQLKLRQRANNPKF